MEDNLMVVNEQKLAPVILMTYARPEHTKKTLDALAENMLAKESELYIFCDGPKNEKAVSNNKLVREIVSAETTKNRFKEVHLYISDVNRGLANSIISSATEIIDKYGKCILLEDDLITAPYFLTYMNQCLDYYQSDERIWAISGFSFPLKILNTYPHDVYLSYRASSHGWATWKDRWETIDWIVKDFKELEKSFSKRRKFNRGGNDLFRMLRHQMRGERDSWAIRFCYEQSKQDRFAIYPKTSLVQNIGFDGSGTHCSDDKKMKSITFEGCKVENMVLDNVVPNKKVLREFKAQYRIGVIDAVEWAGHKLKAKLIGRKLK